MLSDPVEPVCVLGDPVVVPGEVLGELVGSQDGDCISTFQQPAAVKTKIGFVDKSHL